MLPFLRFKWLEMREVARALVARVHAGHAEGESFTIPVVDFLKMFAPEASAEDVRKIAARGSLRFVVESANGGSFKLPTGERALFDLKREKLFLRIPPRMSGTYTVREGGFRIDFNEGEELEGCKRILLLICNRVLSVDVSDKQVRTRAPNPIFDLVVDFE
ncbi:MAG: hypothetical protein NVSMB56_13780 [Pyrinomonadaceae bacterium]